MAGLDSAHPTAYLNAAVVPRVARVESEQGQGLTGRHFLAVEIHGCVVTAAQHIWLHVPDSPDVEPFVIKIEPVLRTDSRTQVSIARSVFQAHSQEWSECVSSSLPS